MATILLIDDDKDICEVHAKFLVKNDFTVSVAYTGEEGLKLLRQKNYDLILCDYRLPDISGVELLQKIKALSTTVAVIVITGYSDVKTAVETFRFGASDYVIKPLYPDELLVTIRETIDKNRLKLGQLNNSGISKAERRNVFAGDLSSSNFIVGRSTQSQTVQRHVKQIAPADMSVVIHGETGTGKEFIAQSIHRLSSRSQGPFIAIDCGALPKELAGSELFGHVKGSFTGAITNKLGSFEAADGGTIFLDEIGNLSYENQVKLLRVIQERKIKPIGGTQNISIDIRIIAATNENLSKLVRDGRFREDLFHRLNEFKIQLSPLRERREDILFFALFFLSKANQSLEKNVQSFSDDVKTYLYNYYWHGNLRELNNVVKRAVLLTVGDVVLPESLPAEVTQADSPYTLEENAITDENVGRLKSVAWAAERQVIMNVLEKVNYNKSKASELLNIDRKTLYNKLRLYNINA